MESICLLIRISLLIPSTLPIRRARRLEYLWYSGFSRRRLPRSRILLNIKRNLSSSCRYMFDRSGLAIPPCGTPSSVLANLPLGSHTLAGSPLPISCKNFLSAILFFRIIMSRSWSTLSKHFWISPSIYHTVPGNQALMYLTQLCCERLGLNPWDCSKNCGSKIASRIMRIAFGACTIRSWNSGIPRGLPLV